MSEVLGWEEFFENFSYKPNWEFSYLYVPELNASRVVITMRVPDSRKPLPESTPLDNLMGKRTVIPVVPITQSVFLRPWQGEQYAKEFLHHYICDMEFHEVGEWFRFKGELVFDPHKEES